MRDLSRIKVMFFDFDNTLAIHERMCEIPDYTLKILEDPENVYNQYTKPNAGIKLFLESFKSTPKFCITLTTTSLEGEVKQMWLDKNFSGEFSKTICTATLEEKVNVMCTYAKVFKLKPEEILFIDDHVETTSLAKDAGVVVMTPQEIMNEIIEQLS